MKSKAKPERKKRAAVRVQCVASAPRGYKRVAAQMDAIYAQFMHGTSTKRLRRKHSLPQETIESVLRMKMLGRTNTDISL